MTNETRELFTEKATKRGYTPTEIENLIMEFNEIVAVHGYAKAYQQFVVRLLQGGSNRK